VQYMHVVMCHTNSRTPIVSLCSIASLLYTDSICISANRLSVYSLLAEMGRL